MGILVYFGENKDAGIYSSDKIISYSADTSVTVVGDTVSIDQLTLEVIGAPTSYANLLTSEDETVYDANDYEFEALWGDRDGLKNLKYGTPMWLYIDDILYGKYYFDSSRRTSETHYVITAVSAMGILDTMTCYGGIYSDATVSSILASILGNSISYSVETDVASIPVRGWLPICTKKDALHQLMLAIGADIKKDANGNIVFYFNNANSSKTIPASRIFIDGTIDGTAQATEVDVTEHAFISDVNDKSSVLFDNTNGDEVVNSLVEFSDAPIHDLTASGTITISEYNCNYAIISGVGKLTGKVYTHTTKITRAVDASATGSSNVATVDAGTLISDLNSGNVAQRLLAYYKSASTISTDIIVDDERSGDKVEVINPFGEQSSAFIKSMEMTGVYTKTAKCEMITGYTPCFQGNTYRSSVVLTGSGTYTVPANKHYLTVICVGGGQGGQGGGKGGNGQEGSNDESFGKYMHVYGEGGSGGSAGSGGSGGKIYQKVISVNPGDVISYSCGAGGAGGAENGGVGSVGGNTTFGTLTSNDGSSAASGIVDRYTGTAYGVAGSVGVRGGNGGRGGGDRSYWSFIESGASGSNVGDYTGGSGGAGTRASDYPSLYSICGSGGGGAAMGANGGNAGNSAIELYLYLRPGNGGDGANAAIAGTDATVYGAGGNGGHGGGGGGGWPKSYASGTDYTWNTSGKRVGYGGNGSAGGAGANGCIIIYV